MEHRYKRKVSFSDCNSVCILQPQDDDDHSSGRNSSGSAPRVDPRKVAREEAYQLICKGYGQLLCGSFEDPIDNVQENINAFVVGVPDMDNARGLERYLSPQHKDERDGAREDVLEAVLNRQRQLRRGGGDNSISNDDKAEKLRNASRRQSRDSKLFARRMGIADELAVREDQGNDDNDEDVVVELDECSNHSLPKQRHSFPSASNAKKALRQPSTRQLDVGIRSMAASMNAKKASRQASIRKLNCSIRNLASSLHSNSSHSHMSCSSASSSSSAESFASMIHPSLIMCRNRNRDQALKLPGRSSKAAASECAELIQSALDLVDSSPDEDDDDDDDHHDNSDGEIRNRTTREVAMSA